MGRLRSAFGRVKVRRVHQALIWSQFDLHKSGEVPALHYNRQRAWVAEWMACGFWGSGLLWSKSLPTFTGQALYPILNVHY